MVSNRESGLGRPDVMIVPKRPGLPGVIFELTVVQQAFEQVEQGRYRTELEALGAQPIHVYVVVFDGKDVTVRRG